MQRLSHCRLLFLSVLLSPAGAQADPAITVAELRTGVATLAADGFEGREAGQRGGRATVAYLLSELKQIDGIQPAGVAGSYVQSFDPGYQNVLALLPGADPAVRDEVVVVGAHFDHVGYGTGGGSRGPTGQVHNGADDNASGTAAVLELAEACAALPPDQRPRRSLLFAFWDAEEKGLLGSAHWLGAPTVARERIACAVNIDMLGRMRNRTVEVYGTRTAAGLRRLVADANAPSELTLVFDRTQRQDSDHWSFYQKNVPYLMFHTGLHEEYHRPSDDVERLNLEGLREATELAFRTTMALANAPAWQFRPEAAREQTEPEPLPQPPTRLGVRWDSRQTGTAGLRLTSVLPGTPAAAAGLRPDDLLFTVDGVPIADVLRFRRALLEAEQDITLTLRRGGETLETLVRLAGGPIRVGFSWADDPAEPGTLTVRRVVLGSAAAAAGVQPGDRIEAVQGQTFADDAAFRQLFRAAGNAPELTLERNGRRLRATFALATNGEL